MFPLGRGTVALLAGAMLGALSITAAAGCGKLASGGCTEKATCAPGDAATEGAVDASDSALRHDGGDGATEAAPTDGSGPPDADSGLDGPADSTVTDAPMLIDSGGDACAACTLVPPDGWQLVAFAQATTTGCPSGFTTMNMIENPDGGTCTCGQCQTTVMPNCNSPTFASMGGTNCGDAGETFAANGSACSTVASTVLQGSVAIAPATVTGSCAAPATPHNQTTTSESDRICIPPSANACLACNPALSPPFTTCLMTPNETSCPGGTTQQHIVSPMFTLECTACSCSVTGNCEGTLTLYEGSSCSGLSQSLLTNGVCAATSMMDVGAAAFDGGLTNVVCAAGTSTPQYMPTSPMTVCCP